MKGDSDEEQGEEEENSRFQQQRLLRRSNRYVVTAGHNDRHQHSHYILRARPIFQTLALTLNFIVTLQGIRNMVIMALVHQLQQGRSNGQQWHPQKNLNGKAVELRWDNGVMVGISIGHDVFPPTTDQFVLMFYLNIESLWEYRRMTSKARSIFSHL